MANPQADAYAARCLQLSGRVESACPSLRVVRDLCYGDGVRQTLDLFVPEAAGLLPVVVFLHGGGFTQGDKAWSGFLAPVLAQVPAILVCASYTLQPAGGVFADAPLADAATLLEWVRARIAPYGGDPDALYLGGHSAGAAIVAEAAVNPQRLSTAARAALNGVFVFSGSLHRYALTGTAGAGYVLPEGPLPVDPGSPLELLRRYGTSVPLLFAWGGQERQRARVERSSLAMIVELQERGAEVAWHFIPEADHFDTHLCLADREHPATKTLVAWLQRP
ncbi:carboxylesterase family protein [Stenotrophomonas sp. MMGLT7]|uniref:alpha/beta hydrolase n=1 Tax=Stenotrophomonas sp. MMGLT7 TaxID=2901227 RepID=UPI001E4C7463|nr:carboxylesterase family protein [Stenotrophomonas sp. MMGLT7]MCD7098792.1 carboxylesterase family protein [Stenotrophomonas sp. MMGLT7]